MTSFHAPEPLGSNICNERFWRAQYTYDTHIWRDLKPLSSPPSVGLRSTPANPLDCCATHRTALKPPLEYSWVPMASYRRAELALAFALVASHFALQVVAQVTLLPWPWVSQIALAKLCTALIDHPLTAVPEPRSPVQQWPQVLQRAGVREFVWQQLPLPIMYEKVSKVLPTICTHTFYTAGGGGDPHFIGLDGSTYEFHGVSGLNFMLVTEPESQLNAQFHNLGMREDNTYIKALGFVHAPSGHRVTVDSGIEDCRAGIPVGHALAIEVDGKPMDTKLQTTVNHPTLNTTLLQLLKDGGVVVDYHAVHHEDGNLAEHLSIHSDRLKYNIHRNAGACHLDVDLAVLDPELLGSTSMHGVLGQTARWVSKPEAMQVLQGDEGDYIESTLNSRDSKYSMVNTHKDNTARRALVVQSAVTKSLEPAARGGVFVSF